MGAFMQHLAPALQAINKQQALNPAVPLTQDQKYGIESPYFHNQDGSLFTGNHARYDAPFQSYMQNNPTDQFYSQSTQSLQPITQGGMGGGDLLSQLKNNNYVGYNTSRNSLNGMK